MTSVSRFLTPLLWLTAGCAHAPLRPDAALVVHAPAGAQIFVDDAYAGPALGAPLPLRSGFHRVEVRADGCFPAYREVDLRTGERRTIEVEPRPDLDAASAR